MLRKRVRYTCSMTSVHSLMRVMPRACWFFLLSQIVWLNGCQHRVEPANDTANAEVTIAAMREAIRGPKSDPFLVLTNRLKQLAGEAARDCGSVRSYARPETATACALSTHADRKPFYVSYEEWGIDSNAAMAFASDADGNVYKVEYDSAAVWLTSDRRKNLQLTDGNHVAIERCSKPVKLRKSANGRIACFLRDL
jgi:hypothetical protein